MYRGQERILWIGFSVIISLIASTGGCGAPPCVGNSNTDISVNACIEHGGIPLFSTYYSGPPVMTSCQIPFK